MRSTRTINEKHAVRRLSKSPSARSRPFSARRYLRLSFLIASTCALATYAWALRDIHLGRSQETDGVYEEFAQFSQEWWASPNVTLATRFMLVIAHPDGECMFFSPTLLNLLRPRRTSLPPNVLRSNTTTVRSAPLGHVLSLSTGNAEGLGDIRPRELRASCWALGIPSPRCVAIDHSALPDSMSIWWPEKTIEELVRVYIEKWGIDLIITFDHYGISGHANHRAIAAALSRAVHKDANFPLTMMLRSTSLLQKYSSLLLLPYSLYAHHRDRNVPFPLLPHVSPHESSGASSVVASTPSPLPTQDPAKLLPPWTFHNISHPLSAHRTFFLSTPWQYLQGRRAFAQHKSQGKWFRRLWQLTSQYMWWNELERVVPLGLR